MKDPKYPLTLTQQKRMVLILRKYMETVNNTKRNRKAWDLTRCDDETRKLFTEIGAEW